MNEDCELKVSGPKEGQPGVGMGPSPVGAPEAALGRSFSQQAASPYIPGVVDLGFWAGKACRRRDDGLCGDPLVPGPRGDPQLDAL